MGQKKNPKEQMSARDLVEGSSSEPIPSEAKQEGRRVVLKFIGGESHPQLDRIQVQWTQASKTAYWQQGDPPGKSPMSWTKVPQALSLIFLDYLTSEPKDGPQFFCDAENGGLATALGNAITDRNGRLHSLFVQPPDKSRVKQVFAGKNVHGKEPGPRRLFILPDYLPVDCIEVYWGFRSPGRITDPRILRDLARRIRKSLDIPVEPIPGEGEAGLAGKAEPPSTATPSPEPAGAAPPASAPIPHPPPPRPGPEPTQPKESPTPPPEPQSPIPDKEAQTPRDPVSPAPETTTRRIDERLFQVVTDGELWPDETVLVSYGGDDLAWTLRSAFEGCLILGATGSGKTSGSGATIAEAFVRAGFGGLILTAKNGEADHWQKLCVHCGRGGDFIRVRRGGQWKLNILSYEAQRPGPGGGLAENLVMFTRNLLKISSRYQSGGINEEFWQKATEQLLHATFDLFLLGRAEITFDRLADFIAAAPTDLPADGKSLLNSPPFSTLIAKAPEFAKSEEDQRILRRAKDYWLKVYPGLGSKTRSSITLGIYAMLDAFRGRDIPELISSDTNLTPESIMSGNIVVIDLPIKEFGHTGLLIQSAWKYLFQTALERQGHAGDPTRRPVFVWEDEAQYFVSDHDHHFQDTARSSRVCRVLLSQNLHSFYREFGGKESPAADSIFGNLNTKIFHANSDPMTNQWAARQFGTELRTHYSIRHSAPPRASGFWDSMRQAMDPPRNTDVSGNPQREFAVQPEEFAMLRTGGAANDYQVDAYITWIGLSDERQRHFAMTTFNQNHNV